MLDEHKKILEGIITAIVPKMEPLPTEQQGRLIEIALEKAYVMGITWGVKSSLNSIKEGLMASCFQLEEFSKHLDTHEL